MLPVRLETRFVQRNSKLQIRVVPDIVHVDQHRIGIDEVEREVGRSYWEQRSHTRGNTEATLGLFSNLAQQTGVARAAWVARATRPTNWEPGKRPPRDFEWPKTPTVDDQPVAFAGLMPKYWVARGHRQRENVTEERGVDITAPIPMAPDFATELPDSASAIDFLKEHGLGWMIDFDSAVDVGLGILLDVPTPVGVGFDELFVTGVPHIQSAAKRSELLESHFTALRYTSGMRFVRRGAATNHTDRTVAIAASGPDEQEYAPELSPGNRRVTDTARRLRVALGLPADSVVNQLEAATDLQLAMADNLRAATWDALEGKVLDGFFDQQVTSAIRNKVRTHALRFHRPGGTLPVVQVGNQPYGIHITSDRMSDLNGPQNPSMSSDVERVTNRVDHYWDRGVPMVPRMNPRSINTEGADNHPISVEQYLADVTAVLASEPNPAQLWLRAVESQRSTLLARWLFFAFLLDAGTTVLPYERDRYLERSQDNLWETKIALDRFRNDLYGAERTEGYTAEQVDKARSSRELIDDTMIPAIEQRESIIEPLQRLSLAYVSMTGKFGSSDNPEMLDFEFDEALAEWNAPIVVDGESSDGGDVTEQVTRVVAELRQLADDAEAEVAPARPPAPASLLWSVLSASVRRVDDARRSGLVRSIRNIAAQAESMPETAIGDLAVLLREHLGGASTRLDAWYSSAAARRLDALVDKETKTAPAPYVGGWGAVLHLSPGSAARSHGFIPAPTLTHAATAAVLRSGYETLGDEAVTAPLAVDLQSDRVRRSMWLVDGIRSGVAVGDLLGARLERRLQEAGEATAIDTLRRAEADARGVRAVAVVDGVAVARSQAPGAELTAVEAAVGNAIDTANAAGRRNNVRDVIDQTIADLDAVADTTVAHAVHSLIQGQSPTARSALESISTGASIPPVPTMVHSQQPSDGVAHTVILHAPSEASTWSGAGSSLRSIADPAAERLAASTLPSPDQFLVEVIPPDGTSEPITQITLDSVAISALDVAIDIAPDGAVSGQVRRAALAAVSGSSSSHQTRLASSSLGAAALAGTLGALLVSGRAATPLDLDPPELPGQTATAADPAVRRSDLLERLDRVIDAGGTLATLPSPDASNAELLRVLRTVCRAELPFIVDADTPDWIRASSSELQDLLGKRGGRVTGWLARMAAVRPEIRRATELIDLADVLSPTSPWWATAAQAVETGGWAAESKPAGRPNHNLCFVGTEPVGDVISGLVVDGWNDSVAVTNRSAAAAVHFDAPGAEAPNMWILAVRADEDVTTRNRRWTLDGFFNCIMNTLLDAQRRMVGPQELPALGQHLPATFLPADTASDQEDLL